MSLWDDIDRARREHELLLRDVAAREASVLELLADWCVACFRDGGKLLTFGNGGSAAQAQHAASEFVNRYRRWRRALPAIALSADTAVVTSIANDDGFARVFARQLEALAGPADLALAFSTTGASANLLEAARTARRLGLRTAAMLGGDGGPLRELVDLALIVPDPHAGRVQEIQLFLVHVLCDRVDAEYPTVTAGF